METHIPYVQILKSSKSSLETILQNMFYPFVFRETWNAESECRILRPLRVPPAPPWLSLLCLPPALSHTPCLCEELSPGLSSGLGARHSHGPVHPQNSEPEERTMQALEMISGPLGRELWDRSCSSAAKSPSVVSCCTWNKISNPYYPEYPECLVPACPSTPRSP